MSNSQLFVFDRGIDTPQSDFTKDEIHRKILKMISKFN